MARTVVSALLLLTAVACAQKILITNDDGWAVAQIRAEYTALKAAGYNVGSFRDRAEVVLADLS